MNKMGAVLLTVVVVCVAYFLVIVAVPFLAETINSANTTMAASSNMSNYPGTSEFMLSVPWLMYFVPGVIGIIVIVLILKAGNSA